MTTTTRFLLILTLAGAIVRPVYAYDAEETHRKMTIIATEKSVLYTDPSIMNSLGLFASPEFRYYARTGMLRTGLKDYKLSEFLAEGSVEEDSPLTAVRHHFYDPVKDRPLTVLGVPLGVRSWEYMLEESPFIGQENSLSDARYYLTYGLLFKTGQASYDEGQRDLALSMMLRTLGHVMHHMQDMAQPQHVRNDQHLSGIADSRYEAYTKRRGDELLSMMNGAAPVYPGSPAFQTARDFWFNSANTGIAQIVNHDFLSYGTNFQLSSSGATTGEYANPVPAGTPKDFTPQALGLTLSANGEAQCANPLINCTMTMYATPTTERASTLSVFDQDLRITGVSVNYLNGTASTHRFFDLNSLNYAAVHPDLIPRAVAYSAGIVNHFLRGKLEIKAPATGPYAAVDHSTGEGFRKIRATVKNLTKDEKLTGGNIRLIAQYHINKCYKPDLSGEFQPDGAGGVKEPCPEYRSTEEYISISAMQEVSFDVDESKQLTFTLDEPIPINASDLMFQVYYTGGVGAEAESFALGSIDVSEPTFVTGMNATDVYDLGGTFYYWRYIAEHIAEAPFSVIDVDKNGIYAPPNDINITGVPFNFQILINGLKVADAPFVPEGRFTRLALIVDTTGFDHRLIATSSLFSRADDAFHFPAKINQYDFDRNVPLRNIVSPLRNDTLQFASTTVYGYYPKPGADIRTMPKSTVTDSTVVVPVVLTADVKATATATSNLATESVMRAMPPMPNNDMPAQPRRMPSADAKPVNVTSPDTIMSRGVPLPANRPTAEKKS